jgi:hypothetical protein
MALQPTTTQQSLAGTSVHAEIEKVYSNNRQDSEFVMPVRNNPQRQKQELDCMAMSIYTYNPVFACGL